MMPTIGPTPKPIMLMVGGVMADAMLAPDKKIPGRLWPCPRRGFAGVQILDVEEYTDSKSNK